MKNKIIAAVILIFGGLYTLLGDVSFLITFPYDNIIINKILFAIIIFILYIFWIYISNNFRKINIKYFGFSAIDKHWAPVENEKRVNHNRNIINNLLRNHNSPLKIVTVSGDWDIIRPFTETALAQLFSSKKCHLKILLCHPMSKYLVEHCKNEEDQDLHRMQQKIIQNSRKLIELGDKNCDIRWSFTQPHFHLIGNDKEFHFGYYPQGKRGHSSHRYILSSEDPLMHSLDIWFKTLWEIGLNAKKEINWIDKKISVDKAIFLDRDGTLIEDLGYSEFKKDSEIQILKGVINGLHLLQQNGFRLIIISNQQAVGLGLTTDEEFKKQEKSIKDAFEKHNIYFDRFYYCKHTVKENCNCRKPKPDLFIRAINDFQLNIDECFFIGDSESDWNVKEFIPRLKILKTNKDLDFFRIVKENII